MKNTFRALLKKLSTLIPHDPNPIIKPISMVSTLTVGSGRSIGKVRKVDQDSLFTSVTRRGYDVDDSEIGLFIVADGMGGHMNGEVASKLAVDTTSETILAALQEPDLDLSDENILNLVKASIEKSQKIIIGQQQDMGTTIVLALVVNQRVFIANVGDSRCYVFTKDQIEQITIDHSLVNRLIEIGQVTKDEAKTHPQKNVLYKALGVTGIITPDLFTRDLVSGEKLLLCSDGLWGCVEDDSIAAVLGNGNSLSDNARELIDLALQAGGPDNITCVLVEQTMR